MAAVPLTDALPSSWQTPLLVASPRTILIGDSIHSDGTFLLHTVASQVLSSSSSSSRRERERAGDEGTTSTSGRVFWLVGGPWTEVLVATALKRFGCEAAASYLRKFQQSKSTTAKGGEEEHDDKPLCILSLTDMLAQHFQQMDDRNEDESDNYNDSWNWSEVCLKEVYRRIQTWSRMMTNQSHHHNQSSSQWIILDDVSSMANLLGPRVVYRFVYAVRALARKQSMGLIVRCSWDAVVMLHQNVVVPNNNMTAIHNTGTVHDSIDHTHSFGAASSSGSGSSHVAAAAAAWELSLVELADELIQVVPLPSGFSRHAHGRLLCSTRVVEGQRHVILPTTLSSTTIREKQNKKGIPNAETASAASTVVVLNYILSDTTVMAIRIRS